MYPRISLNIVAWNGMAFIPELLETVFAQTRTDFSVLLVDNGSSDGVEAFVRSRYPQVTVIRNARNLGFAAGHNQAIRYAIEHWGDADLSERFVLAVNQDIILTPSFVEEIVRAADVDPTLGSLQGKLRRAFTENPQDEALREVVRSERIDSTGLRAHRDRTFSDRGAGEMDGGQYDSLTDIFGPTGALALYRASALADARYRDEFFDQDFFSYKEDVDLAWRLRRLGWKSRFVPAALAYHYRGMYGKERMGWVERLRNRRGKSAVRNWYSTRNHWLVLLKNMDVRDAFFTFPWVVFSEFRRLVYVLLLEPKSASAYVDVFRFLPAMLRKRHDVRRRAAGRPVGTIV